MEEKETRERRKEGRIISGESVREGRPEEE